MYIIGLVFTISEKREKFMGKKIVILALFLLVLDPIFSLSFRRGFEPSLAWADFIQPGEIALTTARYSPSTALVPTGTFRYAISWEGIPVASAALIVYPLISSEDEYLSVEATAQTVSGINWLYSLREVTKSVFRPSPFTPISFYSSQQENSKQKFRRISYEADGTIKARSWKAGGKGETFEFNPRNFTLDPIAAAYVARSLPLKVGSEYSFDVFTAKHRFLITCKVVGLEQIDVGGQKKRDAFKIVPSVKKLTDTKEDSKFRSAVLWISADDRRDILRLESKVWIGRVTAKLLDFVPASSKEDSSAIRARLSVPAKP